VHLIYTNSVSQYYIDIIVRDEGDWRLTRIYGEPTWEDKDRTWEAMHSLNASLALPWLVLGYFNEILYHYEKEGGRARTQRQLQAFHDALADCELAVILQAGRVVDRPPATKLSTKLLSGLCESPRAARLLPQTASGTCGETFEAR
jgi:hypothetical protein